VLWIILGPKRQEATGRCRKLRNGEFRNFYPSQSIISIIVVFVLGCNWPYLAVVKHVNK
jgi:hypothetical protein